jgi:hypothetical protein
MMRGGKRVKYWRFDGDIALTQYKLTPEFFAQRRQSLLTRQAELVEHVQELEAINAQLASIDSDESLAAEIAARYEAKTAAEKPKRRPGRPRRPTPSRPVPSGPRWTAEELAAVAAGDPKDDEALAVKLDRTPGGIAKRRKMLQERQEHAVFPESVAISDPAWPLNIPPAPPFPFTPEQAAAMPAPPEQADIAASLRPEGMPAPPELVVTPPAPEPSSSEPTKPYKMIDDKDRRLTRPSPPKPGRPIEGGNIDNGPGDRRNYHPVHDASRDHG